MKKHLYFKWTSIFIILFFAIITIIASVCFFYMIRSKGILIAFLSVTSAYLIILSLILIFLYLAYKERSYEIIQIQNTFDFYSTKLMSEAGVGIIIFNKKRKIIWVSKLVEQRFSRHYLGRNIHNISTELFELINKNKRKVSIENESEIVIEKDNFYYSIKINYSKKFFIITDITQNYLANKYYRNEKLVLGFVDIDSYTQYQVILDEEIIFKVDLYVVRVLDHMTSNYNVVYKKLSPGKFLLITNYASLQSMKNNNFKFIESLRKYSKKIGVKISLSLGFGLESANYNEIESHAREALTQSHARGGDQITIFSSKTGNIYYGGTTEALPENSRVKIRSIAEKLSTLLKVNSKITKVIITGHKNSDVDSVGAALGLVSIVNAAKKDVYIANSTFDSTAKKAIKKWIKNDLNIFIKSNKATRLITSKTLVIIVDTTNENRIEAINAVKKAKKENIFIFDHHRLNAKLSFEHLDENSYIDTTASSTCEIVAEIIRFMKYRVQVPYETAQFMLTGIYLDTNGFQKTTSYKTYEAASWLQKKGASPQEAVNILKSTKRETEIILKIEKCAKEIKPGFILSVLDEEIERHIIAKATNELLRTSGRKAAFVIGKSTTKNYYEMSARSIDVNVQIIAELVGGGGHFSAAAASSNEPLEVFKDNLIEAIVSVKADNENNNN